MSCLRYNSWAWCLPTGFSTPITYFYVVYFAILLIHRQRRDDHACTEKYGADWKEVCRRSVALGLIVDSYVSPVLQACSVENHPWYRKFTHDAPSTFADITSIVLEKGNRSLRMVVIEGRRAPAGSRLRRGPACSETVRNEKVDDMDIQLEMRRRSSTPLSFIPRDVCMLREFPIQIGARHSLRMPRCV